ncbi:hypothetical protein SMA90_31190, partial [Escherichia coli]
MFMDRSAAHWLQAFTGFSVIILFQFCVRFALSRAVKPAPLGAVPAGWPKTLSASAQPAIRILVWNGTLAAPERIQVLKK